MFNTKAICRLVRYSSVCIGLFLLTVAVYGRWFYEYPAVPSERWEMGETDRTLSELTLDQLKKKNSESDKEYFSRLTDDVSKYMIHFWPLNPAEREYYGTEIPIWENYVLWLLTRFTSRLGGANEYLDPERALQRGYGLCSQHALITANILDREGYQSKLIQLSGHIVTTVRNSAGQWSVVDADYGVYIPHDLKYLELNPDIVTLFYKKTMQQVPDKIRLPMAKIYGSESDNFVVEISQKVGMKGYLIITIATYAIWLIPMIFFLFPLLINRVWPCKRMVQ